MVYTILGIAIGGGIGMLIPVRYGSHSSLTKTLVIIACAGIGGAIGFGYGASSLANGTAFSSSFTLM